MPAASGSEHADTVERSLTRQSKPIRWRGTLATTVTALVLAACGGGAEEISTSVEPEEPFVALTTEEEASRFLAQASFGSNDSSIRDVQRYDYHGWLQRQFAMQQSNAHQAYVNGVSATGANPNQSHVLHTFWKQAATAPDQLRQKVAFALSQILVISMRDSAVGGYERGVASYLDMLGREAFGNYRELLEQVTLHPMMGIYLSHLRNQKPSGNRVPDQNYAREMMQLFSIGLYELNQDGTPVIVSGAPVETYTNDDIIGLSHVFTGFSWAGPDKQNGRFHGYSNPPRDPNRDVLPMQSYPQFHSTDEKKFLGTVIPEQSVPDPDGSLQIALDTIFNHPNVGPFIGRQLIQRLVTSNPSPDYVARVAQALNTGIYDTGSWHTGSGQRGDMRATIAAVLLDTEARDISMVAQPGFGKVREPVLRLAAWMRAFKAPSASGNYLPGNTDSTTSSLGQSALRSPSVFNFYRPGYVPPNTSIAAANLVAPEFQILHETSVVGYSNFMRSIVRSGVGSNSPRDIQPNYSKELVIAEDPDALIDRVDLLLTYRTMSDETKGLIRDAVESVSINPVMPTNGRERRVHLAVFFALSSPDFIVQK
ncbi:MAG: DUF1800 domain-containing protein [Betaproteobacteria bacterium]|nr:MAG: DUF1800 domain-containing protein [Betaproteobacteria bacterium]